MALRQAKSKRNEKKTGLDISKNARRSLFKACLAFDNNG